MYCKICGKKTKVNKLGLCSECDYEGFRDEDEKNNYDYIVNKEDHKE